MPVGSPKPQTIATGFISKSYKLRREVTEAYAEACRKAGVSAAGQLTRMMEQFIQEVNNQ